MFDFIVHCSIFIIHCSLFILYFLFLIVHYLLFNLIPYTQQLSNLRDEAANWKQQAILVVHILAE